MEKTGAFHSSDWVVRHALGLAFGADVCAWARMVTKVEQELHDTPLALAGEARGLGGRKRSVEAGRRPWEEVCAVLDVTNLDNWVWSRLQALCAGDKKGVVPAYAANGLRMRHLSVTAQNLILLDSLDEFLLKMKEGGIPVMPLKGAALLGPLFRLYEDMGARSMSDLDLFCGPDWIDEASAAARDLGYRMTGSSLDARGLGHHRYFAKRHASTAGADRDVAAGLKVTVELHYRLTVWWWHMEALDRMATTLLGSSRQAAIHPTGVDEKGPGEPWLELHVIQLCLHIVKHGMGPDLRNVLDVIELTRKYAVDWAHLQEIARKVGIWPLVSFVLTWIEVSILEPVDVEAPWRQSLGPAEGRAQPLLAKLIPRRRIPPLRQVILPCAGAHTLDPHSSMVLGYLALLPGMRAKGATVTWWLWDRWNLRRFLPKAPGFP